MNRIYINRTQLFLLLSLLLSFSVARAESPIVDSLEAQLKINQVDTQRVTIYNHLAWEYKDIDLEIADNVFELMAKFAGYGFNRSHSAAYGLLTYQTAYLKRYHQVEFFAALMTCDKDSTDSVVKFIAEAREQGIRVERPDINQSDADFTVVPVDPTGDATGKSDVARQAGGVGNDQAGGDGTVQSGPEKKAKKKKKGDGLNKAIRFGLAAVKGVGEGAVELMQRAREEEGEFQSLFDFCNRVDQRKVNRKVIEALSKSGALDGIAHANNVSRPKMLRAVGPAIERAASAQRERDSGQTNLLSLLGGDGDAVEPIDDVYQDGEDWKPLELLAFEKESLGFYISGHPLDRFKGEVRRFCNATTANATQRGPRADVVLGGVVAEFQERTAKSGAKYAFFKLEDQHGQIEFIVRTQKLNEYRDILKSGDPLLVNGQVDTPFGDGQAVRERLLFSDARPLTSVRAEKSSTLEVRLNPEEVTQNLLETLEVLLRQHQGSCRTHLLFEIPRRSRTLMELGREYSVAADDNLLSRIEQLFGAHSATLR